jgi:hypothetical protein
MSDVAQVTTMHRVASARVTHEILRATDGFLRQCRKPHGSRVFFTSELLPAKSRHSCAVIFLLRDAGARACMRTVGHKQKFFSQDALESVREDESAIESARISVW